VTVRASTQQVQALTHRAVLAISQRVLGSQHPETCLICYNLAMCLAEQQRYEEARPTRSVRWGTV
jgi:hypothetical protein